MSGRVLILGGTAEARALAQHLHDVGIPVISSLAGRVAHPRLPAGETRIGGFGGPDALARWLDDERIAGVVDATHPFAQRISASATQAAVQAGVPLVRLERPGWTATPDDDWHRVDDLAQARHQLDVLGARRVLLTSGRQGLRAFAADAGRFYLVRCVDPPAAEDLPSDHALLLARGPYTVTGELALVDGHGIDAIVTKDSGGPLTEAKLVAARRRRLPVVVVRRPPRPDAERVATVAAAQAWVLDRCAEQRRHPSG